MNRESLNHFLVLGKSNNSNFQKYRSILVCLLENMINAANIILYKALYKSYSVSGSSTLLMIKHGGLITLVTLC